MIVNGPTSNIYEGFTINIDDHEYSFQIPIGGKLGLWNIFELNTADIEGAHETMFIVGYDLNLSPAREYNMTYIHVGLTSNGCCGLETLKKYHIKKGGSASEVSAVTINGRETPQIAYVGTDGAYIESYRIQYDDEFSIFFSMNVDKDVVEIEGFTEARSAFFKNVIKSFVRNID